MLLYGAKKLYALINSVVDLTMCRTYDGFPKNARY